MMISPLFTALSFQHIPLLYCGSTCSSSAQPSSRKAANIPAFPLSSTGRENCSLPLRKWRFYQRREQSSLISEITDNAGTHGSHAQMKAESTRAQTPTTTSPRPLSCEQVNTLCTLCDWDPALSSTSCSTHCCTGAEPQKAVAESSFPYQNSVVLANTDQLIRTFKRIIKGGGIYSVIT